MSYKSVPQGCPTRVSRMSVPQECPIRVSRKSAPQECPARVSHKSVPQECPRRLSHKSVPQECPTRVSYKSVICSFSIVSAFGFVGSILFNIQLCELCGANANPGQAGCTTIKTRSQEPMSPPGLPAHTQDIECGKNLTTSHVYTVQQFYVPGQPFLGDMDHHDGPANQIVKCSWPFEAL